MEIYFSECAQLYLDFKRVPHANCNYLPYSVLRQQSTYFFQINGEKYILDRRNWAPGIASFIVDLWNWTDCCCLKVQINSKELKRLIC